MSKFIKLFLLILLGILLSLILLECGLRLAGFTISSYQQYKNNKVLKNKTQYTIMCLGESTTQGQWPTQLQEILNKKYPNKFSIIDCGIAGTNLEIILDLLDNNINKYKPNITICMMGINDYFGQYTNNIITKKYYLKITKMLYFYLNEIMFNKKSTKQIVVYDTRQLMQNINYFSPQMQQAVMFFYHNNKAKAKEIFQMLLKNNPKDEISFYFLTMIDDDINKCIQAINSNFTFMRFEYYMRIINYYNKIDPITTKKFIDRLCVDKNSLAINIDLYGMVKKYISNEEKIKIQNKLLELYSDSKDTVYNLLYTEYLEQKNFILAEKYHKLAMQEKENKIINSNVYYLFKKIIKKLIDNNIKVICMQYPLRSIIPLQEQLKNEHYYSELIFVSNEKLFKDALVNNRYNDIFVDQFAGDFGHCTDLGNTMIAENVVKTLEDILDLKGK